MEIPRFSYDSFVSAKVLLDLLDFLFIEHGSHLILYQPAEPNKSNTSTSHLPTKNMAFHLCKLMVSSDYARVSSACVLVVCHKIPQVQVAGTTYLCTAESDT